MTRDPMAGHEGPVVFAEHPRHNAEAFANLALLQPYASAALLPAHGEPHCQPDALGHALAHARLV